MKVRVSEIQVKTRIRAEIGDLTELKKSIQKFGLLNPILIDLQGNLIAGYRRLESIKSLGWEYVEVKVIDVKSPKERILIEMEENKHRQDFTEKDIERSTEFLEKLSNAGLAGWLQNFWKDLFKKS